MRLQCAVFKGSACMHPPDTTHSLRYVTWCDNYRRDPPAHMADVEKGADGAMTYGEETIIATTSEDDSKSNTDAPSIPQESSPSGSDGGWNGWLTVGGAFAGLFCTFGQLNAFGTFQTWYAEHQLHNLPPSTIAWIGSLQLWIFFFSVSHCVLSMSIRPYTSAAEPRGASWDEYLTPTAREC